MTVKEKTLQEKNLEEARKEQLDNISKKTLKVILNDIRDCKEDKIYVSVKHTDDSYQTLYSDYNLNKEDRNYVLELNIADLEKLGYKTELDIRYYTPYCNSTLLVITWS